MVPALDVVAEQRAFDKRTDDLTAALDAHRPEAPRDLAKAVAESKAQAIELGRAANQRIELASDALRALRDPGTPVGPRRGAVGMAASNVTDEDGRVVQRPLPPLTEPLPDELIRYVEYVRDVYGPAELEARTAAVADEDGRRALKGAAAEHLARCRERADAGEGSPGARLRRALDEWQSAWQRADGAISSAGLRISRAEAECERITVERFKGSFGSLDNVAAGDLAVFDSARPPAMTR
jgi:hypothetical protein